MRARHAVARNAAYRGGCGGGDAYGDERDERGRNRMSILTLTSAQRAASVVLDAAQMARVDQHTTAHYGVGLLQMMENAGRGLARLARQRFLQGDAHGATVHVLAGTGGNGGGVLAAARRLHGWGARVQVWVPQPQRLGIVTAQQWASLSHLGIVRGDAAAVGRGADLVLDGLLGYSLRGNPSRPLAGLMETVASGTAPVLAMDLPSGLHPDTGALSQPTLAATATLTLAAPKRGLLAAAARAWVGELYLADIGVPPVVYTDLGLSGDMSAVFAQDDLVRWM